MKISNLLTAALLSALVAPVFAQTPAPVAATATPTIHAEQKAQQQRIANGVQSGQLTAKEANKLEGKEAKIQADKKLAKADGVVTPKEHRKLKHELKKTSKAINAKKHNDKVA